MRWLWKTKKERRRREIQGRSRDLKRNWRTLNSGGAAVNLIPPLNTPRTLIVSP